MAIRGPRITEAAVVAFESKVGMRLADDYRRFLLEFNGGLTGEFHRWFMASGRRDSTPALLAALYSLDAGEPRFDLTLQLYRARKWLPVELIAIGEDTRGRVVVAVVGGPRCPEIWLLDGARSWADDAAWFACPQAWRVADSFTAFLEGLRPLTAPPDADR
jgi:hypothetical protein